MTPAAAQAETDEKYLTVQDLADVLRVSKWTIYRRYKEWPHSEVGGIRFSPDDFAKIKALICKVTAEPVEPQPRHSAAKLAKGAARLGLPAPRRGS